MAATATQLFADNAATTIATNINGSVTTVVLAPGGGALFPMLAANQFFLMTFTDAAEQTQIEIVKVTAISGDTCTIVRGQEGTNNQSWAAGDYAQNRVTAGTLNNFTQPPKMLTQAGDFALDTGTANAMVVAYTATPVNIAALAGAPLRITKGTNGNTGAVTLVVNGLSAKPVVDINGNTLGAGAIPGNGTFIVVYDNTVYNSFIYQNSGGSTPVSGNRIQLNANLNLYVSTTGNDGNSGTTSGTPWLTLQHAWAIVFAGYDLNGHSITVNIADGTYATGVAANGRLLGAQTTNSLTFMASGTSSTCHVSQSTGNAFSASDGAEYAIQGIDISAAGSNAISAGWSGRINQSLCNFGLCGGAYMSVQNGGRVEVTGNYTYSGAAASHFSATQNGTITNNGSLTATASGAVAFSSAFAKATDNATLAINSTQVTFASAGSVTGTRYVASLNGVIDTSGGGATYYPGNASGTTATGGQYA